MLNTRSAPGTFAVWAIICLIGLLVVWRAAALAPPGDILQAVAAGAETTGLLKLVERFQLVVAAVSGLGLIAGAYLWNGHRDRRLEARRLRESRQGIARALLSEVREITSASRSRAKELAGELQRLEAARVQSDAATCTIPREFLRRSLPSDLLVASLPATSLVDFGGVVYEAARVVRNGLKSIEATLEDAPAGTQPVDKVIPHLDRLLDQQIALGFRCERLEPLFDALVREGRAGIAGYNLPAMPGVAEIAERRRRIMERHMARRLTKSVEGAVATAAAKMRGDPPLH